MRRVSDEVHHQLHHLLVHEFRPRLLHEVKEDIDRGHLDSPVGAGSELIDGRDGGLSESLHSQDRRYLPNVLEDGEPDLDLLIFQKLQELGKDVLGGILLSDERAEAEQGLGEGV